MEYNQCKYKCCKNNKKIVDTRPKPKTDIYIVHEGWKLYGLLVEIMDRESRINPYTYFVRKFPHRLVADRFIPIEYTTQIYRSYRGGKRWWQR